MERLKQSPPKKDFAYFMTISFNGVGTNHQRLKDGRDVVSKKLVETIVKVTFWLGFQVVKFCDPPFKTKVEKNWPLCYGKVEMPYSNLIAKKIVLGIITQKLGNIIGWPSLEKKQEPMLEVFQVHGKYRGSMKKFTKQKGLIIEKCESQLKVESMCKTTKFEIIKTVRTIDGPLMSKDYNLKLVG